MNEYKSFNLEHKETFKSDLGDFTHLQDRIIRFGQSKIMLFLTILTIVVFILSGISIVIISMTDLSFEINGQTASFNWVKIIAFLSIFISLTIPLAASYITYGCKKLKVNYILKGLDIFNLFIRINYIILAIALFFTIIWFLSVLFKAFLIVLLSTIMIGLIYFLYYKFLTLSKEFSYDIAAAFYSKSSTSTNKITSIKIYPHASSLRPFFIILLISSIIGWLVSNFQSNDDITTISTDIAAAFDKIDILTNLIFVINIVILSLVIHMTIKFDEFILQGKDTAKKPKPIGYLPKSDAEDDWRL